MWLPDFNRSLLSTPLRLLETLVLELLKPKIHYRGSDPNIQLIAELALANKTELKTFLGITIVDSDSAIAIVQKLFGVLGLKLTYLGRLGSRGQRERVYTYEPPNDGGRKFLPLGCKETVPTFKLSWLIITIVIFRFIVQLLCPL